MPAVLNAMVGTAVPPKPSKVIAFYGYATFSPYTPKAYEWLPDSGFGSALTAGAALPGAGQGHQPVASNGIPGNMVGICASSASPYMGTYLINSSGYGSKFSNPGTAPTGNCFSVAFTPNGSAVGYGHTTAPLATAYPVSTAGYGTKYSNPSTAFPATLNGLGWTEKGDEVAYATSNSPRWGIYNWSDTTGFGSRLSNSYTDIAVAARMGMWNSTGTSFVSSTASAGYLGLYIMQRTPGAGFSSISNPASQIPSEAQAMAFSKNKKVLAVGHTTSSPYIAAYQWNEITGIGTKYSDPASPSTARVWGLDFSPSGTDIIGSAVISTNSAVAWKWSDSGGFGTKYANPSTAPGSHALGCTVRGFYL